MNPTLSNVLMVAAGGAAGALARFGVVLLVKPHAPDFPMGTLVVNLAGCLMIGVLAGLVDAHPMQRGSWAWTLLAVGVLGGFTTFSSFAIETADMLQARRFAAVAVYVIVSNVVGIALALGGWALAQWMRTPGT